MTTLQGRHDLCFKIRSRDSRDQLESKLEPSYEAEAEKKSLDPDRARSTKSWSQASGKSGKTKQVGVRNRKRCAEREMLAQLGL